MAIPDASWTGHLRPAETTFNRGRVPKISVIASARPNIRNTLKAMVRALMMSLGWYPVASADIG
jgi:hypothetical protein